MKVILTTKNEIQNKEKIKTLFDLFCIGYNVQFVEKQVIKKEKNNSKIESKEEKTFKQRNNNISIKKTYITPRVNEWLEDCKYRDAKREESENKLIEYYSGVKRRTEYY